jgi:predicted AlkP superfamily pyrophosphatase or phosphodiesterase
VLTGCAGISGPEELVEDGETEERDLNDIGPVWSDSDRTVILVSLDGFRWDYRQRTDTPNLDRMVNEGVSAEALIPVFPTKTFPNHFSQVTGLYPAEHGIVGNSFYDPDFGETFDMQSTANKWWRAGEPIWITAANQGRKTTTTSWPGSEAAYDGVRPHHWLPFDGGMPNEDRVDQLLTWMDEDPRPHFGTLYFSSVDHAGHEDGPDAASVDAEIRRVDTDFGLLLTGLEERALLDEVDILVVSDHGMRQLSRDRAVFLDDYTTVSDHYIMAWGPYASIEPISGDVASALADLTNLPHATCSDEGTRDPGLHFTGNSRIASILCLADPGWGITSHAWFEATPTDLTGGTHGYSNADTEMHGVFYGRGPHLKSGYEHPAFESVHLYELMAALLDVEPAENSGDAAVTSDLLSDPE